MERRDVLKTTAGMVGATMAAMATGAGSARASAPGVPLDQLIRLVFLSHVNDPATTSLFPGDPAFELETIATVEQDGYHLQYVREGEHTGTHWGAPSHFTEGALAADEMDPGDLLRPAVRIDIREQAADADYELTVADLREWEARNGRIPAGAAIILQTGWEQRWGTPDYPNLDSDGVMHQPGFGVAAVEWLLETGRLGRQGALGTDTFSPDRGVDSNYTVSQLLYREHRISLENLANLDELPPTGAWVLVGGPRNRGGSGSPSTIFGLVPRRGHSG